VVDIEMLGDRGKKLVFGRAIRELSDLMEGEDKAIDAVVVFVDELNKFAPSGNVRTPLKARLVDITARGRGMGLVLIGAEQFASSVEKEVVENSSTYLFGRTEATELRSSAYAALSDEVKTKLMMLPQGHLLAKFAKFPQPIFLKFPFPPCLPGDQYRTAEEPPA
jgi:DNA helicase HerA-like ATPase